jgi:chromosome segregation ATPase
MEIIKNYCFNFIKNIFSNKKTNLILIEKIKELESKLDCDLLNENKDLLNKNKEIEIKYNNLAVKYDNTEIIINSLNYEIANLLEFNKDIQINYPLENTISELKNSNNNLLLQNLEFHDSLNKSYDKIKLLEDNYNIVKFENKTLEIEKQILNNKINELDNDYNKILQRYKLVVNKCDLIEQNIKNSPSIFGLKFVINN